MDDKGPSLPSNYVTILHLKERWLQQQQQQQPQEEEKSSKSSNHHLESDSQSTHKLEDDSDSKISTEAVLPRRNRPRGVYQVPEARLRDSGSKSVVQLADDRPMVEKQDQNTDQSDSRLSTKKNSFTARNPRFANNKNETGGSSIPEQAEPVQEKKHKRYVDGRRNKNRKQGVREPKGETPPLAQTVDDLSHNDSGGNDVVEAVRSVKEINVSSGAGHVTNRKSGSGRFNGVKTHRPSKPPVGKSPLPAQNGGDGVVEAVAAVKEANVSSASHRANRKSGSVKEINWVQTYRPSKPSAGKLPPPVQNVDGSSHSKSGRDDAVDAAVKEINVSSVSQGTSRKWGSGRSHGSGPWKPATKGQVSAVWVRKGESAPN